MNAFAHLSRTPTDASSKHNETTPVASPPTTATGVPTSNLPIPSQPEPVTLSVITSHSMQQFGQLLAGVVGQKTGECFTIDPIYSRASYLFTLADSGTADTANMSLQDITFQNKKIAQEFLVNMLASSARQWDAIYATTLGCIGIDRNDAGSKMLETERLRTSAACQKLVEEGRAQLAPFAVPLMVDYQLELDEDDSPIYISSDELQQQASASNICRVGPALRSTSDSNNVAAPVNLRVAGDTTTVSVNAIATVWASSIEHAESICDAITLVQRAAPQMRGLDLQIQSLHSENDTPSLTMRDRG